MSGRNMARVALDLAARGYAVFPVRENTKAEQLVPSWKAASTTDAEQVATWFGVDFPDANVCIDTGKSGMVVIDLDVKNGVDGIATWAALTEGMDLSAAPVVRTPSGGRHIYFQDLAGEWRNSAGKLGPGIDVRGVGGYVLAPGSVLPGGAYVLESGTL
ncbi:hypothetical protein BFL35_07755 [Clavibacter michiganensis]|nr:hypothetical protein BFL35_07755 [Clavibacter michiganensis]